MSDSRTPLTTHLEYRTITYKAFQENPLQHLRKANELTKLLIIRGIMQPHTHTRIHTHTYMYNYLYNNVA